MYKPQEIPIPLLRLLAYKRNLPPNHPVQPKLDDEIGRYISGYFGEKSIDYFISLIPNQNISSIHSLRIPLNGNHFQMDTLLKTNKYLTIIEIKNHTGDIEIDHDFGTMTQNESTSYEDPINQVERQADQLKTWLQQNGYPPVPIESLVLFTNKNIRLLRSGPVEIDPRIISVYRFSHKFSEILKKYHTAPTYPELNNIISHLIKINVPFDDSELFNKIGLTKKDFIPGVKCTKCPFSIMERIYGTWQCPTCKQTDKQAHVLQLKDYYLIFGSNITNRQARYWLKCSQHHIVYHLLKTSGLKELYKNKNRVYRMNFDFQKDFIYLLEYNKRSFENLNR